MATPNDVDARRSRLSAAKRTLLAKRLRPQHEVAPTSAIPRRPHGGVAPLSFAQHRLWFLDQLDPLNRAYTEVVALRLLGDLDVAALTNAIRDVAMRHEVLRTTFQMRDAEACQIISAEPHPAAVPVFEDLRPVPRNERLPLALERAALEAARPFDLATGPLTRMSILRPTPTNIS
jgi:hypothetical protein